MIQRHGMPTDPCGSQLQLKKMTEISQSFGSPRLSSSPEPPFEWLKPFSSSPTAFNCHSLITARTFPRAAPSGNALQGYNQSHAALATNVFWVAAANPARPRLLPAFSPSRSSIRSVLSDTNPDVKPLRPHPGQGTGTQIPAASPCAINREREHR